MQCLPGMPNHIIGHFPYMGDCQKMKVGDVVVGQFASQQGSDLVIDLPHGLRGHMRIFEFSCNEQLLLNSGQIIDELMVLSIDKRNNTAALSRKWAELAQHKRRNEPVTVSIVSAAQDQNTGKIAGLWCDYKGIKCYIPANELSRQHAELDLVDIANKSLLQLTTLKVSVATLDPLSNRVTLSELAGQQLLQDKFWSHASVGQLVNGRIMADLGALLEVEINPGISAKMRKADITDGDSDEQKEILRNNSELTLIVSTANRHLRGMWVSLKRRLLVGNDQDKVYKGEVVEISPEGSRIVQLTDGTVKLNVRCPLQRDDYLQPPEIGQAVEVLIKGNPGWLWAYTILGEIVGLG